MSVEMKVRESGSTTPKSQEKDQAILSDSIPVLSDQKSELPTIDEKKLLRKIDWVLIPWLSFLYLVAFLDRSSIGNAKVAYSSSLLFLW